MKKWTFSEVKAMKEKQIFLTNAKTRNMPTFSEIEEVMSYFRMNDMNTFWEDELSESFKSLTKKDWLGKIYREEKFLKDSSSSNELVYCANFKGLERDVVVEHRSSAKRQNGQTISLDGENFFKEMGVIKLFLSLNEFYSESVVQSFTKMICDREGLDDFFEQIFFKPIEKNEAMKLKEIYQIQNFQWNFDHWREVVLSFKLKTAEIEKNITIYLMNNKDGIDIDIEDRTDSENIKYFLNIEELCEKSGINLYTFKRQERVDVCFNEELYFAKMVLNSLEENEEFKLKLIFDDSLKRGLKLLRKL